MSRYRELVVTSRYVHRVVEELVGITEIAEILSISRQRVYQLLESDDSFPEPVAVISAGRIWRRRDVEVWGRATGRLE
jgi:predicted DNA-binding transcriptional regulator AlpA